uniref:Uncharacterized protein n=1 Tax=Rhizophora mucronata TaxID=61149 RepID=A0A2P2PPF0_RHIMU
MAGILSHFSFRQNYQICPLSFSAFVLLNF